MRRVPTFKIKFSYRSIIKFPRYNIDNLIWDLKWLIKLLTDLKHSFHFITALIRMTNDKLLYFFKLMNPKKSMNIFPMSTSLLSKTRRVSTHFNWQLFWFKNFALIISRQWLLACGNQIRWLTLKFVHVVLDCLQLAVLFEDVLEDDHWGLIKIVALWLQEINAIICKCKGQFQPIMFQKVPTMPAHLLTPFQIWYLKQIIQSLITFQFFVKEILRHLSLRCFSMREEFVQTFVVCLIFWDWNLIVYDVSNLEKVFLQCCD